MNFIKLIWLPITDINSASMAARRYSFVIIGLSLLSAISLALSYSWITVKLNRPFSMGNLSIGIISIIIYFLIGIFIKQNNRSAAILPILLMITIGTGPNIIIGAIEMARVIATNSSLKAVDYTSWYGIVLTVVLLIIYTNGVRGVFQYHKYLCKQA